MRSSSTSGGSLVIILVCFGGGAKKSCFMSIFNDPRFAFADDGMRVSHPHPFGLLFVVYRTVSYSTVP